MNENQMCFTGWHKVYAYNETAKNPIFTVTQLSRMGLKPIDPEKYTIHKVIKHGGFYAPFAFYTLDNTQPKRAYKKK